MPYGFDKPKTKPCPNGGEKGKHSWQFVRNGTQTRVSAGLGGGFMSISVRGLYRCACGATRVGQMKPDAPGSDLNAPALPA
jgi:hypothetical protein